MIKIVDMHCHIIPELDDGAHDWEMARKLILSEYAQGVRSVIFTPHYRIGYFETTRQDIVRQFNKMRREVRAMGLRMHLHLGCECHSHERMCEHLDSGFCLTMAKSKYVLVEFSSAHSYRKIRNQIYELVSAGYLPIIAHIERYPCIVEVRERVQELIGLGAYIQVNANSLLGYDGKTVRRFCIGLMKKEQIHFIGSDAHNCKDRKSNIGKCAKYVERKMGTVYAARIFYDNPMRIVRDE